MRKMLDAGEGKSMLLRGFYINYNLACSICSLSLVSFVLAYLRCCVLHGLHQWLHIPLLLRPLFGSTALIPRVTRCVQYLNALCSLVAKHNTPESCWVILYGNVYDVGLSFHS